MTTPEDQLGPHEFLQSQGIDDPDPQFILSSEENWAIQRYVSSVLEIKISAEGRAKYTDLGTFYDTYKSHVDEWTPLFNRVVTVASTISAQAGTSIDYLKEMRDYVDGVGNNTEEDIHGMINDLKASAQRNQTTANGIFTDLQTFGGKIDKDKSDNEGLMKKYADQLKQDKQDAEDTTKQIKIHEDGIVTENANYAYYVKVAASTPAYAWFFPGIIAAVVVAGVYGDKATKALQAIENHKSEIKRLTATLNQLNADILFIESQNKILDILDTALKNFIPVLGKIQGIWKLIADDLGNLDKNSLTKETLKGWKINSVSNAWTELKKRVDTFRLTAYIKVTKE